MRIEDCISESITPLLIGINDRRASKTTPLIGLHVLANPISMALLAPIVTTLLRFFDVMEIFFTLKSDKHMRLNELGKMTAWWSFMQHRRILVVMFLVVLIGVVHGLVMRLRVADAIVLRPVNAHVIIVSKIRHWHAFIRPPSALTAVAIGVTMVLLALVIIGASTFTHLVTTMHETDLTMLVRFEELALVQAPFPGLLMITPGAIILVKIAFSLGLLLVAAAFMMAEIIRVRWLNSFAEITMHLFLVPLLVVLMLNFMNRTGFIDRVPGNTSKMTKLIVELRIPIVPMIHLILMEWVVTRLFMILVVLLFIMLVMILGERLLLGKRGLFAHLLARFLGLADGLLSLALAGKFHRLTMNGRIHGIGGSVHGWHIHCRRGRRRSFGTVF